MLARYLRWTSRAVLGSAKESVAVDQSSSSADSSDEINLVGDQLGNMREGTAKLRWWDLWTLGISTALGGHFYYWNKCYIAGFGNFVIAYFLIASAYGMLSLCMAELSSALPFAGKLQLSLPRFYVSARSPQLCSQAARTGYPE
jgi:hypothetical protein